MRIATIFALSILIAACGTDGGSRDGSPPDAPPDVAVDAGPDGAPDAPADQRPPDSMPDGPAAETADLASDRPADATDGAAACAACTATEICVVSFDGTCRQFGARCAPRTDRCQAPACNADCNRDLCMGADGGVQLTCMAAACPTSGQYPGAVLCYGP
jgi:hypothetical protein